jgi:hypothetical protein
VWWCEPQLRTNLWQTLQRLGVMIVTTFYLPETAANVRQQYVL